MHLPALIVLVVLAQEQEKTRRREKDVVANVVVLSNQTLLIQGKGLWALVTVRQFVRAKRIRPVVAVPQQLAIHKSFD